MCNHGSPYSESQAWAHPCVDLGNSAPQSCPLCTEQTQPAEPIHGSVCNWMQPCWAAALPPLCFTWAPSPHDNIHSARQGNISITILWHFDLWAAEKSQIKPFRVKFKKKIQICITWTASAWIKVRRKSMPNQGIRLRALKLSITACPTLSSTLASPDPQYNYNVSLNPWVVAGNISQCNNTTR